MGQQTQVRGVATNVRTDNGDTVIRYHETDVVRFNEHDITLNSGGWQTSTTKTRMNQASNQFGLGYQVYQKDYNWFVSFCGEEIEYNDGLVLLRK